VGKEVVQLGWRRIVEGVGRIGTTCLEGEPWLPFGAFLRPAPVLVRRAIARAPKARLEMRAGKYVFLDGGPVYDMSTRFAGPVLDGMEDEARDGLGDPVPRSDADSGASSAEEKSGEERRE
jgi:hypothetical protein